LEKKKNTSTAPGRLLLDIGEFFIGTPYVAGTLETAGAERLVVNLREADCVTFVETVAALAWCVKSGKKTFETFKQRLRRTRYRGGRLHGYASRLHYFSDWIHDNQRKGIVRDITKEIGGRPLRRAISFMTRHPDLYPGLKRGTTLRRMRSVERTIRRRPLFIIPKKSLRGLEGRIHSGDIIAITTNTAGMDVRHAGFAAKVKGQIHLLHASSREGGVVLSHKTLYRYLMESRLRTGIMVARIKL
jgi:hypothetical protein